MKIKYINNCDGDEYLFDGTTFSALSSKKQEFLIEKYVKKFREELKNDDLYEIDKLVSKLGVDILLLEENVECEQCGNYNGGWEGEVI